MNQEKVLFSGRIAKRLHLGKAGASRFMGWIHIAFDDFGKG